MTTDRDLAARFVDRGDEEAFRQLFRRHTPRVYAVVLRMLGGRMTDAEDVCQEVWMRAARRLSAFEWRSSLSTWLISVAINCVRERWRHADPPQASPDALAAMNSIVPWPGTTMDLENSINALPDRYREVLVLHDIEGFTHEEIARALDIQPGTSKSHLFHARRALRARLSPSGSGRVRNEHGA